MRRRDFMTLTAGAAAAWPLVVRAQPAQSPVVGFLVPGSETSHGAWVAAFTKRLAELGWTDSRNVKMEYRWAAGDNQRMTEFAAEFVQRKVNVIVSSANGVNIASQATSSIPIVFAAYNDPVASGLVKSLSRPGSNVTGLTVQPNDLASKRVDLLREVVPNMRRLAALANVAGSGFALETGGVRAAAAALNVEAEILELRSPNDIAPALARILRSSEYRRGRRMNTPRSERHVEAFHRR